MKEKNKKFKCKLCNLEFPTEGKLWRHLGIVHPSIAQFEYKKLGYID